MVDRTVMYITNSAKETDFEWIWMKYLILLCTLYQWKQQCMMICTCKKQDGGFWLLQTATKSHFKTAVVIFAPHPARKSNSKGLIGKGNSRLRRQSWCEIKERLIFENKEITFLCKYAYVMRATPHLGLLCLYCIQCFINMSWWKDTFRQRWQKLLKIRWHTVACRSLYS